MYACVHAAKIFWLKQHCPGLFWVDGDSFCEAACSQGLGCQRGVSQAEAGSLFYLEKDQAGQWREGGRFSQLGLADHFVFSGTWTSEEQDTRDESVLDHKEDYWLWLPYTRPSGGSLIRRIVKDSNGVRLLEGVNDFYLGEGARLLPDAIDVWPK